MNLFVQCTGALYPGTNEARCTLQDLISLGYNILHFAFYIATVGATAFIVYGAFVIIISRDDPGELKRGKKIILDAVVGIIVIASAWLVVNTIFWIIGVQCPWYKLTGCQF